MEGDAEVEVWAPPSPIPPPQTPPPPPTLVLLPLKRLHRLLLPALDIEVGGEGFNNMGVVGSDLGSDA